MSTVEQQKQAENDKQIDINSFSKTDEKLAITQNPNDIRIEVVTEKDGPEVLTLLKTFFFKVRIFLFF